MFSLLSCWSWQRALSIEDSLLYQKHHFLADSRVLTHDLVQIQAACEPQMFQYFLNFWVFEARFNLRIFLYGLVNRISLHLLVLFTLLLFSLLFFLVCYPFKMVAHEC